MSQLFLSFQGMFILHPNNLHRALFKLQARHQIIFYAAIVFFHLSVQLEYSKEDKETTT